MRPSPISRLRIWVQIPFLAGGYENSSKIFLLVVVYVYVHVFVTEIKKSVLLPSSYSLIIREGFGLIPEVC